MGDTVVRVENLGKRYRIGERQAPYKTLREALHRATAKPWRVARSLWGRGDGEARQDEIWALRGVSFEVKRGEVVGIIGRNGAGKSTLLKILSRITEPTEGCADLYGRVGSFLEVGAGFHPELTGRENVFLNGAILGMKKAEIERKFDEIVAFAEIDRFIDTPVKHYSSGMHVRLAFAVAAHMEPEILMVDEVLAVGDLAFQKKCIGKMGDVARGGRTVLFVSHNMVATAGLCDWGIVLDGGHVACTGSISDAISYYTAQSSSPEEAAASIDDVDRNGFQLLHHLGRAQIECRTPIRFTFEIACPFAVRNATAGIILSDAFDNPVLGTSSKLQQVHGSAASKRWQVTCDLGNVPLNSGFYHVSVSFGDEYRDHARFERAISFVVLPGDPFGFGLKVPRRWGHFYWSADWGIAAVDEPRPSSSR
ncbi:MAG: ABC transporter ATP-binding protein [Acidobacteria bacterium]|nr:ABC transporter ATP-binding protein [Acidobacteriota bacterium]